MDNTVLRLKLADVLQTSATDLTDDFVLNDNNWDSLTHLGAIAVIDEICGVTVPAKHLKACSSIGALLALVDQSLAQQK